MIAMTSGMSWYNLHHIRYPAERIKPFMDIGIDRLQVRGFIGGGPHFENPGVCLKRDPARLRTCHTFIFLEGGSYG